MPPRKKRKKSPKVPAASDEVETGPEDEKKKKGAKNPSYIDWNHSKPKAIVLEDLISGRLPVDASYMSAEAAWDVHYRFLKEFKKVTFKQFKERLSDHREQIKGDLGRAIRETDLVASHRRHFQRNTTNSKGPIFDLHPAKDFLREDIEQKKHIGLRPSAFQQTRPEYQEFDKKVFRHRIYQEVRRQKFINFLSAQREEGKLLRCEPPPKESYSAYSAN